MLLLTIWFLFQTSFFTPHPRIPVSNISNKHGLWLITSGI